MSPGLDGLMLNFQNSWDLIKDTSISWIFLHEGKTTQGNQLCVPYLNFQGFSTAMADSRPIACCFFDKIIYKILFLILQGVIEDLASPNKWLLSKVDELWRMLLRWVACQLAYFRIVAQISGRATCQKNIYSMCFWNSFSRECFIANLI